MASSKKDGRGSETLPSPLADGGSADVGSTLGTRILGAAARLVAAGGLASLRVRDVAGEVGCSVGSVYNTYEDLDALVVAVNRRTLLRLDAALEEASSDAPAGRVLHVLACAYLAFAVGETKSLRALFEHRMRDGRPFPPEHLALVEATFSRIAGPLGDLLPDVDPDRVAMLSRTLFSAVHGVIALGLEERLVAVPIPDLEVQLTLFVDAFEAGLDAYRAGASPTP